MHVAELALRRSLTAVSQMAMDCVKVRKGVCPTLWGNLLTFLSLRLIVTVRNCESGGRSSFSETDLDIVPAVRVGHGLRAVNNPSTHCA